MNEEKIFPKIKTALFFPFVFICAIWILHLMQFILAKEWTFLGVFPRHKTGLIGIFTFPLIHADFSHLFSNSIPILILGALLFYFYRGIAFYSFLGIYLLPGLWVWLFARENYHIGASGIVYGLAAFLFVSGVIRRNLHLSAVSLVVVFLYGGIVWGLLPLQQEVSYEGHIGGVIAGITMAFLFRKSGPKDIIYTWDEENDENITTQTTISKENFDN